MAPHESRLESGMVRSNAPRLARRLGKFVLEILPPASAAVISGVAFIHHQGHSAATPATAAQVSPASATMLRLVREEHATIGNFIKAQLAAEKSRDAAADQADAQAVAAAKAVADVKAVEAGIAAAPAQRLALAAPKSGESRRKSPVAATTAAAPHTPLVIAQVQPIEPAPAVEAAASESDPLVTRTLNLKEHVVAATRRVAAAISDLPTWIVSMGQRIGGAGVAPSSPARMFSTSS
jgi:hypothetical protein